MRHQTNLSFPLFQNGIIKGTMYVYFIRRVCRMLYWGGIMVDRYSYNLNLFNKIEDWKESQFGLGIPTSSMLE